VAHGRAFFVWVDVMWEAYLGKPIAEKLGYAGAAPEGAIETTALAVCLKAYPDTNRLIAA
jgi:hypothetical protein